jgi:enhancing lycopene biosynthesis protein 2
MKNIAVVLSGCGFLDGAEIREATLTLLALSQAGAKASIFAPDRPQHHVVNHCQSEEAAGERNILEESARIARGEISPLDQANPSDYDAVIIPGGFGVAKNFCDFAFKGPEGSVQEDIKQFLDAFFNAKKPVGAICIAPALAALLWGDKGINVTIGKDQGTAEAIEKTGAKHHNTNVDEVCIDDQNNIVSTAAYMYGDAELKDIYTGIKKCVDAVVERA